MSASSIISPYRYTVALDVDDVLANLMDQWLLRYRHDSGDSLRPSDLTSWEIQDQVKPEFKAKIFKYLDDPYLYDKVNPFSGALEFVRELRTMDVDILFVTSTNEAQGGVKRKWLRSHGFMGTDRSYAKEYIEASDKGRILADVMVDDAVHNLVNFTGKKILMARPHNASSPLSHDIYRRGTYREILNMIYDDVRGYAWPDQRYLAEGYGQYAVGASSK